MIANILTKAFSGKDNLLFRNIFTLLDSPSSFTFINLALKTKFETEIQASVMLSLQNGDIIPISEYKIFPEWLEESEKHYIREHSNFVKEHTLPIEMFRQIVNLESFIAEYSNTEYSQEDWIKILEDEDFVDSLTNDTYSTILCNILEKYKVERAINGKKLNYSSIAIKTEQGIKTLRELSKDLDIMIDVDLKEKLSSSLSNNTISSFCEENRLEPQQILPINYVDNEDVDIDDEDEDSLSASNQNSSILNENNTQLESIHQKVKPKLHRWKTIENQCVEFEEYLGNDAINVSDQNLGYDVESTTPEGETRYIEVKSLNEGVTSFTLTNNEYSSAAHLGKKYYLCLISLNNDSCKILYLKDPVHTLKLTKRVKAWEWFCEEYEGEEFSFNND